MKIGRTKAGDVHVLKKIWLMGDRPSLITKYGSVVSAGYL